MVHQKGHTYGHLWECSIAFQEQCGQWTLCIHATQAATLVTSSLWAWLVPSEILQVLVRLQRIVMCNLRAWQLEYALHVPLLSLYSHFPISVEACLGPPT